MRDEGGLRQHLGTSAQSRNEHGRIDHASAAMGLAIVPEYDNESEVAANTVVITRVLKPTTSTGTPVGAAGQQPRDQSASGHVLRGHHCRIHFRD